MIVLDKSRAMELMIARAERLRIPDDLAAGRQAQAGPPSLPHFSWQPEVAEPAPWEPVAARRVAIYAPLAG